jgi:uncharacterized protein
MDVLADVNILLALADAKHKRHRKVSSWFNELPIGSHMLICRVAQLGLIRLITSNVVMQGEALTMREAWAFYGELLQVPSIYFVAEPGRIQAHWFKSCLAFEQATKRVTDAYLAGFAIAGNYTMVTLDRGFQDFEGLDLIFLK